MRPALPTLLLLLISASCTPALCVEPIVLTARLHHLRHGPVAEWSEFPRVAEGGEKKLSFEARPNETEYCLAYRQQDVKQTWRMELNGKRLGQLVRDENDMVVYLPVPAGSLKDGENELRIFQPAGRSIPVDDVRVGEIVLHERPRDEVLGAATLIINVRDADSGEPLPARLTVVNERGALQSVGAQSNDHLAVRPGTIYTSSGKAVMGLPNGSYVIYAGRGFEYSLATAEVPLEAAEAKRVTLRIRREVPTKGYVACDTHIHSLTHSGHGDATVQERMITIAGEGIELPIATDHNVHISHEPFARQMNVRKYFTPVVGNEVTTGVGHFNIFPVQPGAPVPNHKLDKWDQILAGIYATPGVRVSILNHPRDLHGGTRPFGPKLHNSEVAENLEGWELRANGMEVINSGATQTDSMQLFHDWMAHLNRGRLLAPVGSSDSHDVARHFVGQGRTYIRCDDQDPGNIPVSEAVDSFLRGSVMVSYGLLAEMVVDGQYRSGDLANGERDTIRVDARVLGPHWVQARKVELFVNGRLAKQTSISGEEPGPGIKWIGQWVLDRPQHDVHLVLIARGPGIDGLYWKTAKAYQPTSPEWQAHVLGCSGAIWIDADGDGKPTPAYAYAERLVRESDGDLSRLVAKLDGYDAAVAAQAAALYQKRSGSLLSEERKSIWQQGSSAGQRGFARYLDAWRRSELARASDPAD